MASAYRSSRPYSSSRSTRTSSSSPIGGLADSFRCSAAATTMVPGDARLGIVTGNFGFLHQTLPSVHDDCRRAESYLTTDPRSACFYSRRAVEELVAHLYDVLALPVPYKDDLAARTNDAAFKAVTGNGINAKLNLIRKLGNTAVHDLKPIPPHA